MWSLKKVTHASRQSVHRFAIGILSVLLATGSFWLAGQHAVAVRFQSRSLYINSSLSSATTYYTVSFTYPTNSSIGSVKMLFCTEAIPYLSCDAPSGLDVSGASLSAQTGATGFTLSNQTNNSIIISRPSLATGVTASTYTFTNIINPDSIGTFYVRLNSYSSTDATGPFVDYGSIASSIATEQSISTQVPPILIFCTGKVIPTDCSDAVPPEVEEFPDPEPTEDMSTSTEMYAYTNARGGYVISVSGRSLTSGIYEVPAITDAPEQSLPGKAQFGINLTNNTDPDVGADPTGPATNVTLNTDYTQQDKFLFRDGDVLATSDWVTPPKKITVSYVINIPPDQHPGVYNTTVTYICTGNF